MNILIDTVIVNIVKGPFCKQPFKGCRTLMPCIHMMRSAALVLGLVLTIADLSKLGYSRVGIDIR